MYHFFASLRCSAASPTSRVEPSWLSRPSVFSASISQNESGSGSDSRAWSSELSTSARISEAASENRSSSSSVVCAIPIPSASDRIKPPPETTLSESSHAWVVYPRSVSDKNRSSTAPAIGTPSTTATPTAPAATSTTGEERRAPATAAVPRSSGSVTALQTATSRRDGAGTGVTTYQVPMAAGPAPSNRSPASELNPLCQAPNSPATAPTAKNGTGERSRRRTVSTTTAVPSTTPASTSTG